MGRIVGIDLGTTNSVVAVMDRNGPVVVPNGLGDRLTASVVGFAKSGEILVGKKAKRAAVMNVGRTVFSIKRQMGTASRIKIDGKEYIKTSEVVPLSREPTLPAGYRIPRSRRGHSELPEGQGSADGLSRRP